MQRHFVKHKHHIIPKHMGGTDDPSNLIELSVSDHAQAHLILYEQHGKKEDLCAYYMLSGKSQDPEFKRMVCSLGGEAAHKKRVENGTDHLPYLSAQLTDEEKYEICSSGGKIQGKINADNGHMRTIQKLADCAAAGRKGGAATMAGGKGSFADPTERLKSASKGGKIQGRKNAESGHLKRIAQLPNSRSKGKMWITNGITNMMILPSDQIPQGYRKGKTQK
jgi:HNH endonuclease